MTTDKVQGKTDQAIGTAKEVLGKATGNQQLEEEGAAQKVEGKVQDTLGRVKDTAKRAKKKLS